MPGPILPRVPRRPSPGITPKTWAPVSYTTSVGGLTPGTTLMMPQVSLQSGFNTPYLVDEIRMTAYTGNYEATSASVFGPLSALVSFQFWTGKYFFSQGMGQQPSAVPMNLYAPTFSGGGQYEDVEQGISPTLSRRYSTRRWVLPKPLYMPAGDIVQATVTRSGTYATVAPASNSNITAQVTIVGRALPPSTRAPDRRCVPNVGWFSHPAGLAYSEANSALQNPFKTPWYVQRLLLQTVRPNSPANDGVQTGYGFFASADGTRNYATVKITDSLGYKITGPGNGGYLPLGDIASSNNDCAWTFSRELPVDENYNVAFRIVPGSSTNPNFSPMISFVGYREE